MFDNIARQSILNIEADGIPLDERKRAKLENEIEERAIQLPFAGWVGLSATHGINQCLLPQIGDEGRQRCK